MLEVFLASGALKHDDPKLNFDGIRTIDTANRHGFDGVQLYVDQRYRDPGYLGMIIKSLNSSTRLGLVIHLPNEPTEQDMEAADKLAKTRNSSTTLIHYLPRVEQPISRGGLIIGWENSITRRLDRQHISTVQDLAARQNVPFVFDIGRSAFCKDDDKSTQTEILNFTSETISRMTPWVDVLHIADKTNWASRFHDSWCVLGTGIFKPILGNLRDFTGVHVLEYENLEIAINSRAALKS